MSLFKYYKPAKPTASKNAVTAKVSDRLRGLVDSQKIACPNERFAAMLEGFRAIAREDQRDKKTMN